MDGTIADLYSVDGWLNDIENERIDPYKNACPLLDLRALSQSLNRLIERGYEINIVSWIARDASKNYSKEIILAKREWLSNYLGSVHFSNIDILPYGSPKQIGRSGILFDDEVGNRESWNGIAYDVNNILEILAQYD